jgi:hypothetical protein
MKTCVRLWYLAEFFLKWEMFQTNFVDEIKTHIFMINNFFSKIMSFRTECGKIWYRRQYYTANALCMLDSYGYT